jgi:hypothetical protein
VTQRKLHNDTNARYIYILLFVITAFALHVRTIAQEQVIPAEAKLLTKFHFEMLTGGVVIIQAMLNDFPDTLNFILDTGSGGISLDSTTVDYFKLKVTPSTRMIRGIAGIKNISYALSQTLHFPRLAVERLDCHIVNYDLLSSVYGIRIDGIMGYSFLNRYIVKVNYDNYQVEIWSPGTLKYPRAGFLMKPRINGLPIVAAAVRDDRTASSNFYFDTGAGLCLLMSEDFSRDSAILKKKKKITPTQGEGLGGKKPMRITTVKEVKVGPYRFRNVPAHIFDDEFSLTAYPELGGLIGNDLLRRFNLIINYREKEIHMQPNTHYSEPFDYSYTGLGIYLENGIIVVEDVIEGSPGEKAGLKVGDIIVGIDNNFSGNLHLYKGLLQQPYASLKIVINRGGEVRVHVLTVRSIL